MAARDGLLPSFLCGIHNTYNTPLPAVVVSVSDDLNLNNMYIYILDKLIHFTIVTKQYFIKVFQNVCTWISIGNRMDLHAIKE